MRIRYVTQLFTIILLLPLTSSCIQEVQQNELLEYVNPFIGTADNGHTFPGACVPFGMIQASPQTGNGTWKYCSGYNYADNTAQGFVQSCLNGTGVPDLGDILIFPFAGNIKNDKYESKINKQTEKASPGYYTVTLSDYNIEVELTATQRTAFHKYTFHGNDTAHLYIDLTNGLWDKPDSTADSRVIKKGDVFMPDNQTITGHNIVKAWVERQVFYIIQFDKPYRIVKKLPQKENKISRRYVLEFDIKQDESIQVKIALSTVSIDGARTALTQENPLWNFSNIKNNAYKQWNELLSRIQIEGTKEQKINFYTSMYHLFVQPNNIADTDGRYRGGDDKIHTAVTGDYYSTFSLWDTYRTAHPLYTLLIPERVNGMVQSMIEHFNVQGFLPIWTLWSKENYCMIGNHAIPVIVDAYLKGFNGFNVDNAYRAIYETSVKSHLKSDWETYNTLGYYPFDIVTVESVSRTLESAYDDYCVAQMAKALGKDGDYAYFSQRANNYRNLFDLETKLMRGKDSKGQWRTPFNTFLLSHAYTSGGDYTEGNAWQYTWHVQHDVKGLIELMGGKEYFVIKLDSLFFLDTQVESKGFAGDVTGLIGQYAHGNEPSHHVAYLYNYADRKDKTQTLIRKIFDRFYLPKPDGLCGNDDCGQMSAWYIFSAMGFYPVNPVGGEYILGAPQVSKVSLTLPGDKIFVMEAKGLSKENKYVRSVEWNGKPIIGLSIHHKDIMQGGTLTFIMSDTPSHEANVKM